MFGGNTIITISVRVSLTAWPGRRKTCPCLQPKKPTLAASPQQSDTVARILHLGRVVLELAD